MRYNTKIEYNASWPTFRTSLLGGIIWQLDHVVAVRSAQVAKIK